jgi:two-component system NtrC family sensor kinase
MMKKIAYTLILLNIIFNLYAQKEGQARIDSLLGRLPKIENDSGKVKLLNELSYMYSSIAPDEGIKYGKLALYISKKLKWGKGVAESNRVTGINLFYKSDYSEALKYYDEALKIAEEQKFRYGIAEIIERYGIIYREESDYSKALEYDLKALKMEDEVDNKNGKAFILWDMGNIFSEQSFFNKALEFLDSSLVIYSELNNKEGMGAVLNDIGNMYFLQNDYTQALNNFKKAFEINKKFGYKVGMAINLVGIGVCYGDQGDYVNGLQYEQQALRIVEKLGFKREIIFSLGNIGEYYLSMSNNAGHKIWPDSLGNSATLLKKAIIYLNKSIEISRNTELLNAFQYFSKDLSEAQALSGNYKDALESYKQHIFYKDSIFSMEARRKIEALEVKHETEIKQKEIEILNKDKEIQASEIKRQTLIRNAVLGAAIIAAIFSLLLVRVYNHKRKAAFDKERVMERNKLIENQKTELEKQVTERTTELRQSLENLKSAQKQLIQSEKMASLGEVTAGIAHEIQNPLNFVTNFSDVNKELLTEMKDEMDKGNINDAKTIADDLIENEEKINHHGKRADAIVKGMLLHSRSSTGVKEPTNIKALADEYLRLAYHGVKAKDNSFNAIMKTDFDESIGNINIIPQDIGRVLLNLYNNAFYAVAERRKAEGVGYEPTVSVSTKKSGNQVSISVSDNGNGIPQKIVDKIFQPFFTTKPTGQGTGLGLSLSYDIVKAHGGEIKVETKEGEGSEFIVQLPVV